MGNIRIGIKNQDIFVDVEGRGTAEYCSDLNANIVELLATYDIKRIYFSVKKASYMDSSFIGLILSMKKKFANQENSVFLLNPSDKIVEIFQIMGLDSFVPSLYDEHIECEDCYIEVHQKIENSITDIKLLLESHQNIMETSNENKKRFALVEKVFQKELEQKQNI